MKKVKYILIILIFVLGLAGGNHYYNIFLKTNTKFNKDYIFLHIPTSSDQNQLLDSLKNYLTDIPKFIEAAGYKGYLDNIKPGRFKIKNGNNNTEIINSLRSQNIPLKVTFNNIETLNQLFGHISLKIEADSLSLVEIFSDKDFLNDLNLNNESVFSLFIPNTYEFFWNTSALQFRERILKEFDVFWNDDRINKSNKINLNPIEVMTLASIVQKETPKVDERPTIAGVYLNRLDKRMKLQADPTVVYTIKKRDGFDTKIRRVLYKDLRIKSPYNTYVNRGLPPGPIVTPDISAIEAVLNPMDHSFIYFVADVSNPGYHLFSRTNAEHDQNKRQYTKWLRDRNIRR
ncbi:MAG: endolytic transglycosylase MltG [Flavobacteriaceae bacterium]|nr:endolytic transglycosylase MltG [Flavobacteriaceae bacterium]MBL6683931.1 endolytic transglycosylase MltG [Flavobacteriaceae bacterium]